MADVRFDRLLREEEAGADLAIDEAVRDQLQNLQLTAGRLLLYTKRRAKGNDLTTGRASATLSNFLEAP